MSLLEKIYFNIFIVFIAVVVYTETVTGNSNGNTNINYDDIRDDDQLFGVQPKQVKTTREILEKHSNWAIHRPTYTLQQATEHLLQFGALLRIDILDTFGALVYDHYDDYSIGQTEALYRVYQETLERKYNVFNIVPSILAHLDLRPTAICRHIHKHVRTCLRESSMMCTTIRKHDDPNPHTPLAPVLNLTRRLFQISQIRKHFPSGFSLPAILDHLKAGTLKFTAAMLSGLLHHVQYDNFDDEIRTAERNVLILLAPEMLSNDQRKVLLNKAQLQHQKTIGEVLKELFANWQSIRDTEIVKSFAVLSKHMIREVEAISRNIEIFGVIYENNTIDMKYLLNLVLPPDVVHDDITEAKDYMLRKINDYDIVRKYLKVEKYQKSSPDQLLMEVLGQMRDINFTIDLATALRVHASFWHQSRMINNLNELLELFDAYENLRNVPAYSSLMLLMDKIRNTLWNSTDVTVEILCNNPRACLRLGLEIVAECVLINSDTKNDIEKLFLSVHKSGAIQDVGICQLPMPEVTEEPQTTENPTTFIEERTTTELSIDQTTISANDEEKTTEIPTTNETIVNVMIEEPKTTESSTEWLTISPEDTISSQETDFTNDGQTVTEVTTETESTGELSTELITEKDTSTVDTTLEPTTDEESTNENATEEQIRIEQSASTEETEEVVMTTTEKITTVSRRDASDASSESTDTSSSRVLDMDHSSSQPSSSDKIQNVTTISEKTTRPKSNPAVLLKKPRKYSLGSSEEEDCSSEECSSNSSSDETSSSCDGPDCDSGTDELNSQDDCSGDDCQSVSADCKNEQCFGEQSPECIGDDCIRVPITSISDSNCIGINCLEQGEKRASGGTEETDLPISTTEVPSVRCDNKDPHHQKKLDRLKKIRLITALQPVAHVSTGNSMKNINVHVNDGDSEKSGIQESIQPAPIVRHKKLLQSDLPSWIQSPKHSRLKRPLPWHQTSPNLVRMKEIKSQRTIQSSEEYDIGSPTVHRTNINTNINRNSNPMNFEEKLTSRTENVSTRVSPILQKVRPPSNGYQRVLTRISSGRGRGKWNQENHAKFNENLDLDVPSDEMLNFSKMHVISSMRTSPVVYQTELSDDNVELVDEK